MSRKLSIKLHYTILSGANRHLVDLFSIFVRSMTIIEPCSQMRNVNWKNLNLTGWPEILRCREKPSFHIIKKIYFVSRDLVKLGFKWKKLFLQNINACGFQMLTVTDCYLCYPQVKMIVSVKRNSSRWWRLFTFQRKG